MAGESKNNGATTSALNPVVQPFVEFWSGYAKQANDATREFLDELDDQANIKTFQRRWFDAVTKSVEAYLRSPVFLYAMKQNADMIVKAKERADDLSTEIARNANIPTASDISGLFERMRCRCEEHAHAGHLPSLA
jgi:hypothetical protein